MLKNMNKSKAIGSTLLMAVGVATMIYGPAVFAVPGLDEIAKSGASTVDAIKTMFVHMIGLLGAIMGFWGLKKTFAPSQQQRQQENNASGWVLIVGAVLALSFWEGVTKVVSKTVFGDENVVKTNSTDF